jgi:hypothetical protein
MKMKSKFGVKMCLLLFCVIGVLAAQDPGGAPKRKKMRRKLPDIQTVENATLPLQQQELQQQQQQELQQQIILQQEQEQDLQEQLELEVEINPSPPDQIGSNSADRIGSSLPDQIVVRENQTQETTERGGRG